MRKIWLWLIAVTVVFAACDRTNYEDETIIIDAPDPVILVNTTILGYVTTSSGTPIQGVTISTGNIEVVTDRNGLFKINNQVLNSSGVLIKASRNWYFDTYSILYPKENTTNYARIEMNHITIADNSIDASTGGSSGFFRTPGVQVSFPPNAVVKKETGEPYIGQFSILGRWLDPSDNLLGQRMPGDLIGIDSEGDRVSLSTYGMIQVELIASSGDTLQLKEGENAELTFPIPQELQADAPSSIPLWYFDEEIGIWIEEGQAERIGNSYVGDVGHFSFWNCDFPSALIFLEGVLQTTDGTPLVNQAIKLSTSGSNASTAYGYTNNNGRFRGYAIKDEVLTFELISNCGDVFYSTLIGPFSSNVDLGIIQASPSDNNLVTITAQVVDCIGEAVTNGAASVRFTSGIKEFYPIDENGNVTIVQNVCGDEVMLSITGYDFDNLSQGDSLDLTYEAQTNIDVGPISACENPLEEFLRIRVRDKTYLFLDPRMELVQGSDSTNIFASDTLGNGLNLYFYGNTAGTFPVGIKSLELNDLPNIPDEFFKASAEECHIPCESYEINITNYGSPGEKLEGSLNETIPLFGTRLDGTISPIGDEEVEIQFSIIR